MNQRFLFRNTLYKSINARNALSQEFGSAAQLSKRPGSVWNCLWENALKRSPGTIRKSRVHRIPFPVRCRKSTIMD